KYAYRSIAKRGLRCYRRCHVDDAPSEPARSDYPTETGRRVDRGRLLQRKGWGAARHLATDGEGALRCPEAEARRRATEANPARVPRTDRRRSALKGLAPGRSGSGGLTAPHPWPFAVAGAACLYPTVVNRCRAHEPVGGAKQPQRANMEAGQANPES